MDIFHNEVTAWLVLVTSILFTVLGWSISNTYVERRAADRFSFEVDDARQRILKRMLEYEQVLRGGVSLIHTLQRQPTRQEWHEYVSGLEIETYYPGIQGIGYAMMLDPSDLSAHVDAIRAEGFPDYRIHPEGERAIYSSIVYLEPFDWRNQRAFGYDMFSNPMRRRAMELARDNGQPALSGRVTLVQETEEDVQAGFLVYLPVYAPGQRTESVQQRREALLGFVYSPFRMDDLMRGILGSDNPDVGFEVHDGEREMTADTLLYGSNPDDASLRQAIREKRVVLPLPGRNWMLRFHSRPSFEAAMSSNQPVLIAIGGTLVDALLFIIIWSMAGERQRVKAKAHEMTSKNLVISERLDMAQASANIGTWDYDVERNRLIWDKRMFQIYAVPTEAFQADFNAWRDCVVEQDRQATDDLFLRALAGETEFNTHFRIRHPNGDIRMIEAHATVFRDDKGRALRVVGVNMDVTERQHSEEQLELAAGVFEHAREGIVITDAQERILRVNPTFCELTGYTEEEVLGQTPRTLKSGHHGPEFYADMWRHLNEEGYWHGEIWNRRKNGEVYAELLTISAVRDKHGDVTRYVAIFSDITKLKDQQVKLERMAHYDALTQLPNRVMLADRMQQAMAQARRTGSRLAVCYLDLDGFKPVNDSYGHEIGDKLLVEVASRLNHHMRVSDTVARLGGDEFALLFCNLDGVQECERALIRLLEAMTASYRVDQHVIVVSASVGVTVFPDDNADADTLLRHADQAMYRAKENGRNRFHLFDPEQDRQMRAHREALTRIESALENGEFVLFYQPKVDMRQGVVIGAEALIRWDHPQRGLLPPSEFLPVVEEGEFSVRLGEWVLAQVLRQLSEWLSRGFEIPVSVNISGHHFQLPEFSRRLAELMQRQPDVAPALLELEVLETSALEDIAQVSRVIQECRGLGVAVALDDFGTGYSSLTYLKRLPADILKIDQTFVRDMLDDVEDLAIIEGIIGLCQAFRRRVIAEGIESEEHGVMLLRLGCDLGQGYGIARPMPLEALLDWKREWENDREWRELKYRFEHDEGVDILAAIASHRHWVEGLKGMLEDPPLEQRVQLDSRHCAFGRWFHGVGYLHYGHLDLYDEIKRRHEGMHSLGQELVELCGHGFRQEALNRVAELESERDGFIALIEHLQGAEVSPARQRNRASSG